MPTYKITLAYDGTLYSGWQQQPQLPSVFETVQKTFQDTFKTDVHLLGASRTDAGVHALGQVVCCVMPLEIPAQRLVVALNNNLPPDIHVRNVEQVPESFHPWYNVVSKTYYYHIFTERPLPFIARYGWYYQKPLDFVKLESVLVQFIGTHDFRSFCSAQEKRKDTVRTIDALSLHYLRRFNIYRIRVTGKKFLHHMIRRLVGASVQIASDPKMSVYSLQKAFAEKNPNQRLMNAPAQGLLLRSIVYTKDTKQT